MTYTVTVINTGNDPAYDVEITDKLPDNLKYVAGSITDGVTLAGGGTVTGTATKTGATRDGIDKYDFRWVVSKLMPEETVTVSFSADVVPMPYGVHEREFRNVALVNNIPTNETEHYQYSSNLAAIKYSDPTENTLLHEGDIVTYYIDVINNGADTAYDIPVSDAIPVGTVYVPGSAAMKIGSGTSAASGALNGNKLEWTIPALASRETATLSFQVEVQRMPTNQDTRKIDNVATVDDFETNHVVHTQSNFTLHGVKKSDPMTGTTVYERKPDGRGDIITYIVEVTNEGLDPAYDVEITDQLPDNLDYVTGSITTGTALPGGGTIAGTATKLAQPTESGVDRYEFKWIVSKLMPGEVAHVEFKGTVMTMPQGIAMREFRNVAYVNNHATNETVHYQYAPHLRAVKHSDPVPNSYVRVDDVITYFIDVYNDGADTEYNIDVLDSIPAGTELVPGSITLTNDGTAVIGAGSQSGNQVHWVIDSLAAGRKAVLTFQTKVLAMPKNLDERTIDNVAKVNDFETNHVTHLQTNYAVYGQKSSDKPTGSRVHVGEIITYTIEIMNKGADAARNVKVRDMIPLGTTYVANSASTSANVSSTKTLNAENELEWTIVLLAPNGVEKVTFQVMVDELPEGDTFGVVDNFGYVDEKVTNTVTHEVRKDLLLFEKTASPVDGSEVMERQRITYKIALKNIGDMKARNVVVTDQIPAGTKLIPGSISHGGTESGGVITWNLSTWSVGEERTLTFAVEVLPLAEGESEFVIENRATVKNGVNDPGDDTNTVRHIVRKPVLEFFKDANPPSGSRVKAGDIITYTIVVRNKGTLADHNVHIEDLIPEGTTYVKDSLTSTGGGTGGYLTAPNRVVWTIPELAPAGNHGSAGSYGGEVFLTFKVKVNPLPTGVDEGLVKNKATIWGYDVDGEDTNETEHIVSRSRLSITKEADPPDNSVVQPGEVITYTLKVTNDSADALEYVPVWDTIPAGTTYVRASATAGGRLVRDPSGVAINRVEWVIGTIAPGQTIELKFKVRVDALPEGQHTRKIFNAALVGEGGTEEDPGIPKVPSNEVEHDVIDGPIKISKSSDPAPGSYVYTGQTITYTLTLRNASDAPIVNVPVRDFVPEGTTFVTGSMTGGVKQDYTVLTRQLDWLIAVIPAGGSVDVTFKVIANELPFGKAIGYITNQGFCGQGGGTEDEPGTPDTPSNEVTHIITWHPIEGRKESDPPTGSTVEAGATIEYTVYAVNNSGAAAENVAVIDPIPLGTYYKSGSADSGGTYDAVNNWVRWTIPHMEDGETVAVKFSVIVGQMGVGETGKVIYNQAIVNGSSTNTVTHNVVKPELYGVKSSSPASGSVVYGDQRVDYTVTVHNNSAVTKTNVIVRDTVPLYTNYITGTMTNNAALGIVGTYSAGSRELAWTIASIPAGGSVTLQFTVTVDSLPAGVITRVINNVAYVNGLATNQVTHHLYQPIPIGVKEANPPTGTQVKAGDEIEYTLRVYNYDRLDAHNVVVRDAIPTGTDFITGSETTPAGATFTYDATKREVRWVIASLPKEGTQGYTFTFKVRVQELPENLGQRVIRNIGYVNDTPTNETNHYQQKPPVQAYKYSDPPSGSRVPVGSKITYSIRVTNPGTQPLANVHVMDYIPAGTKYITGSVSNQSDYAGAYSAASDSVSWLIPTLQPGTAGQVTLTFEVEVQHLPQGMELCRIINLALVNGNPTNQTTHVVAAPKIEAEKIANPPHLSEVLEGQVIRYTITVRNVGEVPDYNIKVLDQIPQFTTLLPETITNGGRLVGGNTIEWTIAELLNGAERHLSFDVVADALPEGVERRRIENTAVFGQGGEDPENPTNTVEHNVNKANVVAVKSANPAAGTTVGVGDIIQYTISLKNEGALNAPNTEVYDEIPAGTTFVSNSIRGNGYYNAALNRVEWSVTNIQAGSTAYVGFSVRVNALPEGATEGTVRNAAVVDGEETPPVEHPVALSNVTVVKTANPPSGTEVMVGDTITYTITVANHSQATLYNIPVQDTLPSGTTFVADSANNGGIYYPPNRRVAWLIPTLGAGESIALTFSVTVDELPPQTEMLLILNKAYFHPGSPEPSIPPQIPDKPTNETEHPAYPKTFSAEKTSIPASGSDVNPGDVIDYTVTVRNFNATAMANVAVTDILDADLEFISAGEGGTYDPITRVISWTIPSIPALHGAMAVTFRARVTANPAKSVIHNQARANDKPTNTTVHYPGDVPPINDPRVLLAKSADPAHNSWVAQGETITYYIDVRNVGQQPALNVVVRDAIPAGTVYVPGSVSHGGSLNASNQLVWNLGTLPANSATTRLSFRVTVDYIAHPEDTPYYYHTLRNTAYVDYNSTDGRHFDGRSEEVIHNVDGGEPRPYFYAVKSADPADGSYLSPNGQRVRYTITVYNMTGAAISGLRVYDLIPGGTTYVPGSAGSTSLSASVTEGYAGGRVSDLTWNAAYIAAGSFEQFYFSVDVPALPEGAGYRSVRNSALVTGGDRVTSTNQVIHYQSRGPIPPDVPVKTAVPPSGTTVRPGDEITYTVTARNGATAPATIIIRDAIPAGTEYVTGSATNGAAYAGNVLTWTFANVPAGASVTATFRVKVLEYEASPWIVNVAQVNVGGNSYTTDQVVHYNPPVPDPDDDIRLDKVANPVSGSAVTPGQEITYTINVVNTSARRIENITVTDPVPVGTVYIPGSADNAGSFAGNSLTWAIAALEAGETKTLTFKARVMDYPTYLIRNVAYANYENRNVGSNETVHYPGPPQFRVEKNANPVTGSIVQPGQEIYYTVTVTNLGSQMLRPVQITDNIPAGTTYVPNSASIAVLDGTPNAMAGVLSGNTLYWNLAGLAPGMSAMAVFKVTVDALPAGISGRLVRNSANVTGNGRTLITNEVVHYVGRIVEMDLRKDSDPAPNSIVTYGQEITYTLTLTNYAQTAQTDITVSDTIPAGTQYVSGGTLSGNAVVFQVARIEPSESKTFTFTVRVLDTAVFGQLIRNTARAIWGDKQIDSNEVDHTVNPNRPNVQASKRSTPASGTAVVAGQTIRYTIELRNLGGSAANGVTVRDSIPAGTTFAGAASDGGQYNAVNNELRWSVASIPAGGTVELWFEVTVNARASASMYVIRNTAYYVPTPGSPEQPTNEVTNVINPSDGLRLQKRSDPAPGSIVNTGSTITYYLDVINGGDVDETDVRVSDAIPAGLQYVAGSANYGGTLAGGTVHWLLERVAANSTVTLRFQATVLPPAAGSPAVRYFRNIGMVNGQPSNPVDHVDIVEVQYPSAVGSKRADPAAGSTVQPGRTVTYYIDVINNGNVNLTNIPVRDTIPAGTTYVAGSATSGGTLSGNELRWTIPALNVGQVFTVAFQVTVNQLQPGENSRTIRNIAIISGPQGETPTPEVPHIVFPDQPGLRLVKTSSKQGEVKAGEELTYTLTVTNSGAIQQTAIRVTDSIPAGTEYVAGSATDGGTLADGVITWTIAQLAPGGSKSVSFKVTVLPLPENTLYRIIRNVGYLNNEPGDPVENPQVPELPVTGVKRADPPAGTPLTAGRLVTYYIDVTNHNAKTASNVVVRDTVPTGTSLVAGSVSGSGAVTGNEIVWTIPSLAGGQTVTVYFTVTVDPLPAGVSYRIIRNQAIVAAPDPDHPENPPVETPTPPVEHPQVPPMPGLYLYKVSNRPANSPVQAGDEITYSLTATNYGTAEQTNVIITDAIPAGTTYVEGSASEGAVRSGNVLTWVIASLPAGASRMVSFRVTVDPLPEGSSGRVIRNIGYINGQPGDPVEHPEVPSQGGVYGSKRANPPAGTVLRAGDVVTYSIDVTNYYGKTASNVTVRDSIPAGVTLIPSSITMGGVYADGQIVWSIPAIAAGQTVTVSFQAVVNPLLAGVSYQIIRNQAIVAAPDPDHPEQPPIEVPTPPVEHPQIPPVSGLWVQKTSSRPSYGAVRPGDELTYYLTVTNYGSEIRTNVQVVDSIPQGTTYVAGSASDSAALNGGALIWVIASLAPGASKTVSFRVRVNELPSGQSAGVIRNVGYVNGTPSNPEENPVIPNPPVYEGVTGNKRANPAAGSVLHAGDVVTYSIDVTNHYSKTVANVAVRDSIPAGTTLVPSSITAGGVYSGGQIVWSIPSLAPGQTVTVSFSVTVNALPAGVSFATIRNQAIVAAPNPDRPDLPPVETPTPPVEHPQLPPSGGLYLHKSSNTYGSVQPGQEITYTITLVNYGGTVRENIVVTDSIPQGTAYVAGSASDGGTLNGNVLSWTVASLAPGQSKTLTFRVTVNADATGSIRNTAYVDGNPSNPDEVPVIPVIPQPGTPDVVGTKRSDPASGSSVQAGQAITYYIHVTNRSNRAASNVTVRDAIPAGTTLIAGSIDNGGTEAGGTVTWSIPSLGAGATMVLSFRVTVNALAAGTSYAVIRNRAIITGPSNGGSGPVVDSPTNDVTHDNTPPRLDVVKSADRNVSKKDDVITYTIRVYNRGSSAVSNVIIRDQIPAGTRYVNNSANPAAALSGDVLTWNVASIPAGGSATVSFQVKVTTDAAGTIANTANAGVDGDGDGIPDDGGDDSNTVIVDNNNNGGNGGCNCGNGGGNGGCNCGNGHGNGNGNGDGDGQSGGNNGNSNINIDNTNNNNNSNGGIVNNVTNGNGNGGSSGTTGNGNSGAGNGSSNGSGNTGNGIGNSNGSGNGVGKVPNTNEASAMWAILVMACSAAMIALVLAFRKSVAKRQRKLR
ncbi:MAG: DUF11 domain-containing protein [Oscillospiraceae bacterium]|nr:DUF11 domain-containing protein [Oscillospiraceae bacterium]